MISRNIEATCNTTDLEISEVQGQVLLKRPSGQDQNGNHAGGDLNRGTDADTNRNFHLAAHGHPMKRSSELVRTSSERSGVHAHQTEVTCSAGQKDLQLSDLVLNGILPTHQHCPQLAEESIR